MRPLSSGNLDCISGREVMRHAAQAPEQLGVRRQVGGSFDAPGVRPGSRAHRQRSSQPMWTTSVTAVAARSR